MRFRELRHLIRSDLHRYTGGKGGREILRTYLLLPGFKYSLWLRISAFLRERRWMRTLIYPFVRLYLLRLGYKYGIEIPCRTRIGSGLYIGHFGGIIVNGGATIGRNCNLSQGVTIGRLSRGKREGCPVIGDNVYIGPGAKVIGRIRVGNGVAIGANAVVIDDVPDNGVVVGVPGRVVSFNGSEGYIIRTDYPEC